MYTLICTSFNDTEQGLVFRNNWLETVRNSYELNILIERWNLKMLDENGIEYFLNIGRENISNILTGRMDLDNVVLHCRIVKH